MRPNVWQRMDSDLVPEFMADNDVEASRMFDWSPVNEPSTRPGVVPGYGNGAAKSSTSSNAISTAYDITTMSMAEPLATFASLATWNGGAPTAGVDNLHPSTLGFLSNGPIGEVNSTVLTKGLVRHMLVSRGALEKEAAARAAESSNQKRVEPELTPEQSERRQRRRDRNKAAATRCRQRRRDHMVELEESVERMTAEQKNLEKQVAALLQEQRELEEMLARHKCIHPADAQPHVDLLSSDSQPRSAESSSAWQPEEDMEGVSESDDDSESDFEVEY